MKTLRRVLYIIICLSLLVATIIFLFIPKQKINKEFTNTTDIWDSKKVFKLYELSNTSIFLNKGDIFKLGTNNHILRNSSIGITTKFDLGKTHNAKSANSILFRYIKDTLQFNKDYDELRSIYSDKRIWSDKLDSKYKEICNGQIYLAAGIPAKTNNEPLEQERILKTAEKIQKVTYELIEVVKKDDTKNLAITFFGTGAARVPESIAINSILNGINETAVKNKKELNIIIVLYPDEGSEAKNKEWLDNQIENFSDALNDKYSFDIWKFNKRKYYVIQILLLLIAPCIAGLISTYDNTLNKRIWIGPIVKSIFKWSFLVTGLISLKQGALFNLSPINWSEFVIYFCIALIIPLWDWKEFSKLRNDEIKHVTKDMK